MEGTGGKREVGSPKVSEANSLTIRNIPGGSVSTEFTCNATLGREDPLEKKMATRSSILAWEIP